MRQKNLENGNSENTDSSEASSRYLELQNAIVSISNEDFEQLKKNLKIIDGGSPDPKTPKISYTKLLIELRENKTMSEVKMSKLSTKNLSDDLDYLEDIIVKHFPLKRLDNKLLVLKQAETSFELKLNSKGFRILEKLKKSLTKEDHWISWRILELSLKHYGRNGRNKFESYSNLYQLSKHISNGFDDEGYIKSVKSDYEASLLGKFIYLFKKNRVDVLNEMLILLENLKQLKENIYEFEEDKVGLELNKQVVSYYIFEAFEFLNFCNKYEFWGKKNLKDNARELICELFIHIFPYSFHGDNHLPNAKTYFDAMLYENLRCFAVILNNRFQINIEEQPEILFNPPIHEITTRLTLLKLVEKISIIPENGVSRKQSDFEELKVNLNKLVGDSDFIEALSAENKLILYGLYVITNDIIGFGPKRPPGKYNSIKMKLRNTKYEKLVYDRNYDVNSMQEETSIFEMCLFKIKRIERLNS